MTKLLLTVAEAAEAIGVGRSKTYELLNMGALRSVRIGTSRRIPAEDGNAQLAHSWSNRFRTAIRNIPAPVGHVENLVDLL